MTIRFSVIKAKETPNTKMFSNSLKYADNYQRKASIRFKKELFNAQLLSQTIKAPY